MTVLKWGSEQLVNTAIANAQSTPSITALPNGGFVVAWEDLSETGGDTLDSAIRMQRYDPFGNKVGAETLVNTTAVADQTDPSIATLADGSLAIFWKNLDILGTSIRFRRFDAGGTPLDANDRFLTIGADADVSVLPGTGMIVALAVGNDIIARRLSASGTQLGAAIAVSNDADVERDPAVAGLSDGSLVVGWVDQTTGQVHVHRFLADGAPVGPNILVNNPNGGAGDAVDIVPLDDGHYVVVCQDAQNFITAENFKVVRMQVRSREGNLLADIRSVGESANDQTHPSVTALPGGGFMVVFENGTDILGQVFDSLGTRVGRDFLVNTSTLGTQGSPVVAGLADGRVAIAWTDQQARTDDGSGSAIRLQIVDPRDGSITGTAAADLLLGHDLVNDELNGLEGSDTLNGLGGSDHLYGGDGDDAYVVGAGDSVFEQPGAGTDLVKASVSFTLSANVENLTLLGAAAGGTGNTLANTITGNAAANTLNGLGGADTMLGLAGNDSYVVENVLDTVSEAGGGGIDTVISSVNLSLVASARVIGAFERLTLTGGAAITGTGNNAANLITGNNAANVLSGGVGNDTIKGLNGNDAIVGGIGIDTLTGGLNNDSFVFNAPLSAANRDVVTDFNHVNDVIRLENAVMSALGGAGALKSSFFFAGAVAHDPDDHVIYNKATGALFFDSNGIAAGGVTQLATLTNRPANVDASDFVVI